MSSDLSVFGVNSAACTFQSPGSQEQPRADTVWESPPEDEWPQENQEKTYPKPPWDSVPKYRATHDPRTMIHFQENWETGNFFSLERPLCFALHHCHEDASNLSICPLVSRFEGFWLRLKQGFTNLTPGLAFREILGFVSGF